MPTLIPIAHWVSRLAHFCIASRSLRAERSIPRLLVSTMKAGHFSPSAFVSIGIPLKGGASDTFGIVARRPGSVSTFLMPMRQTSGINTNPKHDTNFGPRMQSGDQAKVALVTGSSRGIGRACALALAEHGCNVVVNYASSSAAADDVVQKVKELGQDAVAVQANVADSEQVDKLYKATLDTFGRVDIVVNNAGITRDTLAIRMKKDQWQDVIDLNLTGVFMCTQTAAKLMLKQRSGRIVNISSIVGLFGNMGQANYAAAKAGVIGLTMSVAKECAARGITVNAVAPGFIRSDMTASLKEEEIAKLIPMNRVGEPDEVAGLIRFLALDPAAAYITGHTFTIDGGLAIGS